MDNRKSFTIAYGNHKIQLLEWDIEEDFKPDETLKWEPEFEVHIDKEIKPEYYTITMDVAFYLCINKEEYAAMIKVRNVFYTSKPASKRETDSLIGKLMDIAITHARAMCVAKALEEKINLPLIPFFSLMKLHEITSLLLIKPSLLAFTHERREMIKEFTVKVNKRPVNFDFIKTRSLWFIPKPPTHPDSIIAGYTDLLGDMQATLSFNFDYEYSHTDNWKMHLDFSLQILPLAAIKQRSSFSFSGKDSVLFAPQVFEVMVEETINNCVKAFKEQCAVHNIEFDGDVTSTPEMVKGLSDNAREQYEAGAKPHRDKENPMYDQGMYFTPGGNTLLVMKGTFMIMDELLFLNPLFNHKHNLEKVQAIGGIFEAHYETIKANCLELENGPIQLNWMHTVFFFVCLDIALQMVLSDHVDTLASSFIAKNFIDIRQQEFITFGNQIYEHLTAGLIRDGAHITNLEERHNWAEIIQ